MSLAPEKMKQLCRTIGYNFQNLQWLELALTHSSARISQNINVDNERLEFLGDRVLGLVIADLLFVKFGIAPEGELAKRYNALVRRETCCAVARQIDLGKFVIMSDSERASGGAEKETILADVCESLLGAIFKDAGFSQAEKMITTYWQPYLEKHETIPADPKSTLQEWAQGQGKALPSYVELERSGPDHEPLFTTEVRIGGVEPAVGKGTSKRAAEHNAAESMLKRENVWER